MLEPKRLKGLTGKNVVPVVRLRSADGFEGAFQIIRVIRNDRLGFLVVGSRFLCTHHQVLMLECRLMKEQRRPRPSAFRARLASSANAAKRGRCSRYRTVIADHGCTRPGCSR